MIVGTGAGGGVAWPGRMLPVACLVALVPVGACSSRAAHPGAGPGRPVVLRPDAVGPTRPVAGARRGGRVTVLLNNGFEHLDPGRTYVARAQLTNQLLHRTLTAYRRGPDGRVELVGDLATDTGRPTGDGLEWTFTLRAGLRFENGRPITAGDVAYGIARSFSPALTDGPTWLQQWLADDPDFARHYAGPSPAGPGGADSAGSSGSDPAGPGGGGDGGFGAPGVSVPDGRTLVLRFARPHPDLPFVVSLGNTAPVPRSSDTGSGYDQRPVASGPYRIEHYEPGRRLELVRNQHWDPGTDPVRPAYPDRFEFTFGVDPATATRRVLDRAGGDRAAVSMEQIPPELLVPVARDRSIAGRTTVGTSPYVGYIKINTRRVADLTVRRALNCAVDRDGYVKVAGGRVAAEPATTILPRIAAGYRRFNAYDCGPAGDAARSRRMLGDRTVRLRYGYRDNATGQRIAEYLRTSLGRAGFDLRLVPIDPSRYYSTIGTGNNGLDLYLAPWGADWPTGAAVLPALVDGRRIAARGNSNTSYFDDPGVNAEIDRILGMADRDRAATAWGALDEQVMREHAPLVPLYYDRTCTANGPELGGLYLDDVLGVASLVGVFVR